MEVVLQPGTNACFPCGPRVSLKAGQGAINRACNNDISHCHLVWLSSSTDDYSVEIVKPLALPLKTLIKPVLFRNMKWLGTLELDWKGCQFIPGLKASAFNSWYPTIHNKPEPNLINCMLYLPTQIRFLIGGERITCHGSNLHDALGRSKLHNALGKQQL